jgi:hypothetical protein
VNPELPDLSRAVDELGTSGLWKSELPSSHIAE